MLFSPEAGLEKYGQHQPAGFMSFACIKSNVSAPQPNSQYSAMMGSGMPMASMRSERMVNVPVSG
jgi:hypothetical protein